MLGARFVTHSPYLQLRVQKIHAIRHPPTTQLRSGYGCRDLDPASTNLLGFGVDVLPDHMCVCLPGFFGTGTSCTPCNTSSYNGGFNAPYCTPCPDQGTGRLGARSVSECKCSKGRRLVHNQTACGCGKWYALGDEECVSCAELHLNCSEEDSNLRTVPPLDGFARLDPQLQRGHEIRTINRCIGCTSPNLLRLNVEESLT